MNEQEKPPKWYDAQHIRLPNRLTKILKPIAILLVASITLPLLPSAAVIMLVTLPMSDSSENLLFFSIFVVLAGILISLMNYLLRRMPWLERKKWLKRSLFPVFVVSTVVSFLTLTLFS